MRPIAIVLGSPRPFRVAAPASAPAARRSPALAWALAAILAAASAAPLLAQTPAPEPAAAAPGEPLTISRASGPIDVDGALTEAAWEGATSIPLPWEWSPADNAPAPVATEVLVTFDDDRLYVGFRAHDPDPSRIRARYADRDEPFSDDTVGFFIDPFNDARRAFQFRINALGVQMDAVNSDVEGSEDWSWNIIWDSAGRITAEGYTVEVAIPFRQLRFPQTSEPQTWGFLAMRDYPRSLRHRMRTIATDTDRNCLVCQFQKITGFQGMETGKNLEVSPTLTARGSERRSSFPDGGFETAAEDVDPGLSARWGITPNIWLNATLNPDFSQVEADSAQLDANTRFALFFPERRPFFLEAADFFDTPMSLVFTRTVADPKAGLKLTGKEGPHAFGTFFALDRINNLIFPGAQGSALASVDDEVTSGVLRWRRDLGETSAMGVLYTGREGSDYSNHVVAVDGLYRFTESDSVSYQLAGSATEYPGSIIASFAQPDGRFSGRAIELNYRHQDRNWFWFGEYEEASPEFRADSGFITQVGVREASGGVQYQWRGEEGDPYSNLFLFLGVDGSQEWDGAFNEWGSDLVFVYTGPKQSVLEVAVAPNQEHFDGVTYHNLRYSVFGSYQPAGWIEPRLNVRWGETIDFAGNRQADLLTIAPGVELRFRRFQSELSFQRQELDVEGGRLLRQDIFQTRSLVHFNRRMFVRAIFQWRDLVRDPALFPFPVQPKDERLLSQFLFSYRLDAQTAFLLGYSDNYRGLEDVSLTQTDRTVFAKLSYAFLW